MNIRLSAAEQRPHLLVQPNGELPQVGFYSGAPWRLLRQICAVFVLDKARVELAPILFPSKFT